MNAFPIEKSRDFRILNEDVMFDILRQSSVLAPAEMVIVASQIQTGTRYRWDALVDISWRFQTERFVVEAKSASFPAIIEQAMIQSEIYADQSGALPMVLVPYLSDDALDRLAARDVSGIDLCGNYVILGSKFSLRKSGAPNLYPDSRTVQNPYNGDSSIFARSFLLRTSFNSLTNLREFAVSKTDSFTAETASNLFLGTASKVVKALAEDLIIYKDADGINLIDSGRLLANLRQRYRRIETPKLLGKTLCGQDEVWLRMAKSGVRRVATGIASAGYYGVLSGVDRLPLYVDDLSRSSQLLEVKEGRAFANIELIEDRKNLVYFDNHPTEKGEIWASPIQTWLELAQGGPREQEAAIGMERHLMAAGRTEIDYWNH